jgi:hypothetical protein
MANKTIEQEKERSRTDEEIAHETSILRSLKPGFDGLLVATRPSKVVDDEYEPMKISEIYTGEDGMLTVELTGTRGASYRIEEEEDRLAWFEPREEDGEPKPAGKVNGWRANPVFTMRDYWDEE